MQVCDLPDNGRVEIFVANESNTDVFFDDILIRHEPDLICQENHYDPWGLNLAGIEKAGKPDDKFQYNGKEKQTDFDLNWMDYEARQMDAQVGRFWQVDPHAHNYSSQTPYNYAFNNPILFIDPDGRDGIVTGTGTKDNPFVVKARYYYYGLNAEQAKGLQGAVDAYNNNGKAWEIKVGEQTQFVKFDLGAEEVADIDAANEAVKSSEVDLGEGKTARFGNVASRDENLTRDGVFPSGYSSDPDYLGSGNSRGIAIIPDRIDKIINKYPISQGQGANGSYKLMDYVKVITSVLIHEIGHNLTASHGDPGKIMQTDRYNEISKGSNVIGNAGTGTYTWSMSVVDKDGVRAMIGRMGASETRVRGVPSITITPKELRKIMDSKDPGTSGRLTKIK